MPRYQRNPPPAICPSGRIAVFVTSLLFLGLIMASVSNATSDRLVYDFKGCCSGGFWGQGQLYEADVGTGENVRTLPITLCCDIAGENWEVSPNGREVAYEHVPPNSSVRSIYITDISGANQKLILENGTLHQFDPTGTKLLVSGGAPCNGLCTVKTDGTNFVKLPSVGGRPSYSPDGTHLVWAALGKTKKTENWPNIFIANADGSSVKQVTNLELHTTPQMVFTESGQTPRWGPGNTIAFVGQAEKNAGPQVLWKINSDGTGLARIPNAPSPLSFSITPTLGLNITEGCEAVTINFDGTGLQRVLGNPSKCANGQPDEPLVAYRAPSTTVGMFDALAARYEPVLRFDTSESWRPLNVEAFFAENQHHLCEEGGSCAAEALKSSIGLNANRSSKAYINIAGTRPSEGGGAETYHSPYAECTVTGLRDCDTGSTSAVYYRSPGVFGGYEYVDYWYFYRANYFLEGVDFHEGDWEGATVAPSLTGDSFDYAGFSQHGTYYSYLGNVLRCEDSPTGSLPERGTCGGTHSRVDDLVSNGDHANYTTPCKEELPTSCQQNGEGHFEAGYDGTRQWGRAYDDPSGSLLKMPTVGTSAWTDWPGKWGSPAGSLGEGSGPPSPGNQTFKIECASIDNEPGCTTGPRTASVRRPSARISDGATSSPGLTAVSCSSWAGEGVSAVACNPKELRQAVITGHVGATGRMNIAVAGTPGRGASGRGIAQYAGGALSAGAQLRLSGPVTKETEVLVRSYDAAHRHIVLGKFKLGSRTDKAVARTARLRLRLRVGRTRNGHVVLSLGRVHAQRVAIVH